MSKKYEYAIKYVFRERGVSFHPPFKKLRPRILIRGKMNTKRTWAGIIPIKIRIIKGNAAMLTEIMIGT